MSDKIAKTIFKIIFSAIILFFIFFNLYQSHHYWTDGDEPHYLVITHSLLYDKDLDLKNNYENMDYKNHHGAAMDTHAHQDTSGGLRSAHQFLTPLILIPGYFATNNNAVGPKFTMLLMFFCLIYIVYLSNKNTNLLTNKNRFGYLFLLTSPVLLIYSTLIYSEIVTSICLVSMIYFGNKLSKEPFARISALCFSFAGAVALLNHIKSIVFLIPLLIVMAFYNRDKFKNIKSNFTQYLYFAPLLFGLGIQLYFSQKWYETFNIFKLNTGLVSSSIFKMFEVNPILGVSGQLFDYDKGLLWLSPSLIFISLGFYLWFKKDKQLFLISIIPSIFYILINSTFNDWKGGFSPSGRYLVPIIFTLLPSFLLIYEKLVSIKYIGKIIVGGFLIANLFIIYSIMFLRTAKIGYPTHSKNNLYVSNILNWLNLDTLNPYFMKLDFEGSSLFSTQGLLSVAFFVFLSIYYLVQIKSERKSTPQI